MVRNLGNSVFTSLKNFLYGAGFFWQILKELFRLGGRNRVGRQVIVMQVLFTGVNALFIIALIALSLGALIILQGGPIFGLGSESRLFPILITVVTTQLGPLLTAFIVMARSGVAIATELSNMVIAQEIEAYLAVGINPLSYLVVPRFLGVTLSLFALNLYFTVSGLAGSYFVVQLIQPIPALEFFTNLLNKLTLADVMESLIKSVAFGAVISFVSSYNGFKATNSTTEIPVLVIRAVGQGFGLLIVTDVLITLVFLVRG